MGRCASSSAASRGAAVAVEGVVAIHEKRPGREISGNGGPLCVSQMSNAAARAGFHSFLALIRNGQLEGKFRLPMSTASNTRAGFLHAPW